ncbi:fibrous sheath CABYR-binding protein-like, partial [Pollicipes pollicipes]|uniref:fibrous sheath CABYR-binding protein-like n=1 Tax=Pollicipes pollicipes TaxID=41117 RepID=UPI0018854989
MPTMRPLLCLLLCGWCGAVPLVSSSSGRQGAPPAGRQVAPSQQILGELQYLFRQAAAGQQPPAEYGAAREELDQMLAGLDQLAAVVPSAQHQPPVQPAAPTMTTEQPADKPIIDPGLFVIQGVQTCGAGAGYCVLGYNCSSDNDFEDDASGHCHGLRTAFTPSVEFSCCRFDAERRRTATPRPTPTTTEGTTFDDGLVDSIVNFGDEMPEEPHGENSQIVDIVAIITDSTGIVDIVTRPYTGPWPPSEEQGGGAVTLPFAKPGETFEPGSMVGLGQNNVNLGTTSLPPAPDAFQAGDLPPPEEEASLPAGADVLLTTAATTPASVATSTPPGEPSTAAAEPPPQQLGPLANVPVMDQNLDYIGDVDYDQHLLPALMPIRPGTKAGGVEATLEGSGDAPAPGDDLLPLAADVAIEGSGSGAEAEAEAEAMHEQAPEESTPAPQIPADAVTAERPAGAVTATPEEDAAQTGGASGSGASAERPPSTQPAAELEEFKAGSAQEAELKAPPQNAHGSVALSAAMGSLSTSVRPPVCGMMGSSLASLLARSRYRHRG